MLHDINTAGRFCDDMVALKGGGQWLTSGSAADLIRSGTLDDICGVPMGIAAHPNEGALISSAY